MKKLLCILLTLSLTLMLASAALAGALLCAWLWTPLGAAAAMLAGAGLIILIRLLSAHYHWSLPRPDDLPGENG